MRHLRSRTRLWYGGTLRLRLRERALDGGEQRVAGERLLDDRSVDAQRDGVELAAVPGHVDDLQLGPCLAKLARQLVARHVGHHDVRQHQIDRTRPQLRDLERIRRSTGLKRAVSTV